MSRHYNEDPDDESNQDDDSSSSLPSSLSLSSSSRQQQQNIDDDDRTEDRHQQQQGKPPTHPRRQRRKSRAGEDETSERPATDKAIFTPLQNQKAEQRRQKQQRSANSSSSASTSASSSPGSHVAPVVLDQNFDHRDKMGGGRGTRNSRKSGTPDDADANNTSNTKQNLPVSNGDGANAQNLLSVPRKSGGTLHVIENFATYTITTVGNGEKIPPDVLQEQKRLQCAADSHKQADTKACTERRLKIITELRGLLVVAGTEVYLLRGMRRQNLGLVNENKSLKEANESLQARVEKLKERVKKLKNTKLSVAHTICSGEQEKIKTWFQEVEWHETKFISSEIELVYVTKKVFVGRGHDKQVICRDSWVKTYCKYILQVLGGCRNYLTQELKKVALRRMKAKQNCPTHVELLKCAKRDIDINKPEEVEFFAWYYEEVMPKILGPDWKTKLYYTIVSQAVCPKTSKKLITPQDEAMAALVWENNEGKWPSQSSWKADPANKDKHIKNSGGKYTTTTGGKTEYNSWSPEGLEKFNSNVAEVKKSWVSGRQLFVCLIITFVFCNKHFVHLSQTAGEIGHRGRGECGEGCR